MFSHLCRVTHMSLKLGVVMDPIESINYKKDTTLALLWARKTEAGHCSTSSRTDCLSRGRYRWLDHARFACTGTHLAGST